MGFLGLVVDLLVEAALRDAGAVVGLVSGFFPGVVLVV